MCVVSLGLTRFSEASPLQKHRIKQNYPLFVAYKVIAKGHGRLPSFLFASPVYLIVNTDKYATGRGGPTQELNNNFQQSSQEAGSPDCGCSLLSLFLPPHSPTLLPSPPPLPLTLLLLLACVCSTGLMHSADRPALLKRHRPHFYPLNHCSGRNH